MKRISARQVLSVLTLLAVTMIAGCGSEQSSDGVSKPTPTPTSSARQGVVDDLRIGVNLDLSSGPWTTAVNGRTFAQVVYHDASDCVQKNCPTLLIQSVNSSGYKGRVVDGKLAKDNGCAEGASAFESPVFKGTTKIAGMHANYYVSAPCGDTTRTRRDWVTSKFIFTETSDDKGGLAEAAFDKALKGAVVKN